MKKYILVSSVGVGSHELNSFDNALFQSKIANYNLVKISSILPINAKLCKRIDLEEGCILYTAYAQITTKQMGEHIAAAVAVGIPKNKQNIGVIMEYSSFCNKAQAEDTVKNMVLEAMKLRGYEIAEIQCVSAETVGNGKEYSTAFAALAIWDA